MTQQKFTKEQITPKKIEGLPDSNKFGIVRVFQFFLREKDQFVSAVVDKVSLLAEKEEYVEAAYWHAKDDPESQGKLVTVKEDKQRFSGEDAAIAWCYEMLKEHIR